MSTNSCFIVGLAILSFLTTSCNSEEEPATPDSAETFGSITVTLKGEKITTHATDPTQDDATDELKIHNFKVYVFNSNTGALEKTVEGVTNSSGEATITHIDSLNTAGSKNIVVLANIPAGYPAIDSYADLGKNQFDLGLQSPANRSTTGLVMSGESGDITLSSTTVQTVPITIKRVVAKIELKTILINPDPEHTGTFVLTGVGIQKAKGKATAGPTTIMTFNNPVYGGHAGSKSTVPAPDNYLWDPITDTPATGLPKDCNNYFYVFPNTIEGEETLITISGTYNGITTHFPFRINHVAGSGSSTTDGTRIKRNTRYLLNVTLKKLGSGSTDPDIPGDPAAIDVTVTTENWEGPLTQDVEW